MSLPYPSRSLDAALHQTFIGSVLSLPSGPVSGGRPIPAYTSSIDAAVMLCETTLPGWIWRLCSCHVSDDAWLMPDMGHPDHAKRFQALWPDCKDPLEDGPGLDMSFTPAGRPALALVAVHLQVVRGLIDGTRPEAPEGVKMKISTFMEDTEAGAWPRADRSGRPWCFPGSAFNAIEADHREDEQG